MAVNPRIVTALVLGAALAFGALLLVGRGGREETAAAPAASDQRAPGVEAPGSPFEGAVIPPGVRAPDFSLRNQDGQRITMAELRGHPVVVTFLYTSCDETCPPQAQQVRGAFDDLGRDLPFIAIAVDPPRDTRESARHFLAEQRLAGRLDFVLGSRRELAPLWKGYAVAPQSARSEHQARTVLVDRRGMQRVSFPIDQTTPERIAHDLRVLLAE